MAGSVLVDAGFLVALLSRRDGNHRLAAAQPSRFPPPWKTCKAVLSEAFHLLGARSARPLTALLRRRAVVPAFGHSPRRGSRGGRPAPSPDSDAEGASRFRRFR